MKRLLRFAGRLILTLVVLVVVIVGALYVYGLKSELATARQEAAKVRAELESEKGKLEARLAEAQQAADAAKAEAAKSAGPKVAVSLDSDERTRALFPKGAFLVETDAPGRPKVCSDRLDVVQWVRLNQDDKLRSTTERFEISPSRFVAGVLTLGLSTVYGPKTKERTIFAARSEGPYVTLLLGALRGESDQEEVGPQIRVTLYRIDKSRLGVVEWVPIEAPPAARPTDKPPEFSKILRVCVYRSGSGSGEL